MTGGLMQLVAYGAQDIYLTGNPMITYFKVVYRRHTNFAMESIQQTFNGTADFGNKVTALVSRNGDLIHNVYLQADLPDLTSSTDDTNSSTGGALRWTDDVGHHLLKQVDVEIGGQLIDRQYGDWLEIWAQLTVPAGQQKGYREMIGQDPLDALGRPTGLQHDQHDSDTNVITGRTIYVPLQFWFCRNVGLALPLIALQYHEVKINVTFRTLAELTVNGTGTLTAASASLSNASLWVDYIYLDTDERRRFAQVSHEYLIEQLQYTGAEAATASKTRANPQDAKITLNFNHPVKELVWVCQAKDVISENEWSNYTTVQQYVAATTSSDGIDDLTDLADVNTTQELLKLTGQGAKCPPGAQNPVVSAKLQLNGHDRFAERPGTYFNWVQCWQHHSNIPASPGINVYSFALKPEDHQPSGTCNFSRIDNATLQLKLALFNNTDDAAANPGVISGTTRTDLSCEVRVYALNYNVLRIMSGMGGLAYSN